MMVKRVNNSTVSDLLDVDWKFVPEGHLTTANDILVQLNSS